MSRETDEQSPKPKRKIPPSYFVIGSTLVVLILFFGSWLFTHNLYADRGDRGAFGSMFGAVSALFSGLAFALLIVAIYLQTEELALQRQELKDTRVELEGQKEQLFLQNKNLEQQRFENTFFEMLKLHNEIVNSMEISSSPSPILGRRGFNILYNQVFNTFRNNQGVFEYHENPVDAIEQLYTEFYSQHEVYLGHYFRNLYHNCYTEVRTILR
jgi:hypothetical protein